MYFTLMSFLAYFVEIFLYLFEIQQYFFNIHMMIL